MGIHYENLDQETRQHMAQEFNYDCDHECLYISTRLNETGVEKWRILLRESITKYNDDWLAQQLQNFDCLNSHLTRTTKSGTTLVRMPRNASETLAEGEFNRLYARGLCSRAIAEGIPCVQVYRGKEVVNPRPESQCKIGELVPADKLLEDLRTSQGIEPALGIPPGPNSGLTIRLPR